MAAVLQKEEDELLETSERLGLVQIPTSEQRNIEKGEPAIVILTHFVPETSENSHITIDKYLLNLYPIHIPSLTYCNKKLLFAQCVTVNGTTKTKFNYIPKAGEKLVITLPKKEKFDPRYNRKLAATAKSCMVKGDSGGLSIVYKVAGVGAELSDSLPLLFDAFYNAKESNDLDDDEERAETAIKATSLSLPPAIIFPLDKAASGLVLVKNTKPQSKVCDSSLRVSFTYTVIVTVENNSNILFDEILPGYSINVFDTVISNTDGTLLLLRVSSSSPMKVSECLSVKKIIDSLSSYNIPVLGHAKRRCSSGKGLFLACTSISIYYVNEDGQVGDAFTCDCDPPLKFNSLLEKERKFTKASPNTTTNTKDKKFITFGNLQIHHNEDVMTPCKSSTILSAYAINLFKKNFPPSNNTTPIILDAGTGSGCLLLSILHECQNAEGYGIDISREALVVARENSSRLGFEERCSFYEGEFSKLGDVVVSNVERGNEVSSDEEKKIKADILICNPPYHLPSRYSSGPSMEQRRFDPGISLFGLGEDGLDAYRDLGRGAGKVVKLNGFLVVEIPNRAALEVMQESLFEGWKEIEILYKENGKGDIIRGVVYQRDDIINL